MLLLVILHIKSCNTTNCFCCHRPSRLDKHKRLLGFVPQDDVS